jgi:hypothetical protein
MESRIKDTLILLLASIKSADGPAVAAAMEQLDGFLAESGPSLHPQLAHYLQNRSYAKALAWLGGESGFAQPSNPPGGCGRHA